MSFKIHQLSPPMLWLFCFADKWAYFRRANSVLGGDLVRGDHLRRWGILSVIHPIIPDLIGSIQACVHGISRPAQPRCNVGLSSGYLWAVSVRYGRPSTDNAHPPWWWLTHMLIRVFCAQGRSLIITTRGSWHGTVPARHLMESVVTALIDNRQKYRYFYTHCQ